MFIKRLCGLFVVVVTFGMSGCAVSVTNPLDVPADHPYRQINIRCDCPRYTSHNPNCPYHVHAKYPSNRQSPTMINRVNYGLSSIANTISNRDWIRK